jgi:hypothetical protein
VPSSRSPVGRVRSLGTDGRVIDQLEDVVCPSGESHALLFGRGRPIIGWSLPGIGLLSQKQSALLSNQIWKHETRASTTLAVRTARFPELAKAFEAFARPGTVFDGEIVRLKQDGISSFASLQEALSDEETGDLVYYAFALLFLDGVDLRASTLESRKQLLAGALENAPANIRLSEFGSEVERNSSPRPAR